MFGVLPKDSVQFPHRHESVALDYIIDCQPGCYMLIGMDLDKDSNIINPKRADWKAGSAFVTPPGYWHAHYNESGAPAHLIPIQDAGLHTYLRSLDIKFYHPNHESFISLKAQGGVGSGLPRLQGGPGLQAAGRREGRHL